MVVSLDHWSSIGNGFETGKVFWTSRGSETPYQIMCVESPTKWGGVIRTINRLKVNGEKSTKEWRTGDFEVFETYDEWRVNEVQKLLKQQIDFETYKKRKLLEWEETEKNTSRLLEKYSKG